MAGSAGVLPLEVGMAVYLTAIGIVVGVFLGLSILLLIAEIWLVDRGSRTVKVNNGENVISVPGGATLLSVLQENKIIIPSACGGKGTCGYCKVRIATGGGPVLPTELPFLSRTELRSNTRLACQVKVKKDMDVQIPDFLATVRNMVKNKTYDPRLRWRFLKNPQVEPFRLEPLETQMDPRIDARVREIVAKHKDEKGAVVPILQEINSAFNHLPEPVMSYVSDALGMELTAVYRISTFYNAFSLKPRGRHTVSVCLGTACHVKGAAGILSAIERELGIKAGETTPDMQFSLQPVRCIGCCGLAPVVVVGEDVHGHMSVKKITSVLDSYRKEPADVKAAN